MAMARRVSLFEREVRVRLAPVGVDVLFAEARVLTEGQIDDGRYHGSTMMTVDLAALDGRIADPCDIACARRVTELAAGDDRIRDRARRVAIAEAGRKSRELTAPVVDVHVHREGRTLHIDLDVEAWRKP
jgi:hypothetical protein